MFSCRKRILLETKHYYEGALYSNLLIFKCNNTRKLYVIIVYLTYRIEI